MTTEREIEILDENYVEEIEVEDENEFNFVMLQFDVVDSLIFDDIYEKMVYIVLKRFANFNTKTARPSIALIAKLCPCSVRKVQDSIQLLEAKNMIHVKRRKQGNKNLPNKYTIKKLPDEVLNMHYKKVAEREQDEILEVDVLLEGGAQHAPGVVHSMHQGGAQHAPGVVHSMHQGGAHGADERYRLKDIDLKDIKKEEEEEKLSHLTDLTEIFFNNISKSGKELIKSNIAEWLNKLPYEVIKAELKHCALHGAKSWQFVETCLNKLQKANVTTIKQQQQFHDEYIAKSKEKKQTSFKNRPSKQTKVEILPEWFDKSDRNDSGAVAAAGAATDPAENEDEIEKKKQEINDLLASL